MQSKNGTNSISDSEPILPEHVAEEIFQADN